MLTLKIKFKGSCEKHPRYDPSADGEAGIKGGCLRCTTLLEVWTSANAFRKTADTFLHTQQPNESDVPLTLDGK
jgi:hypothetical protein